MRRLLAYLRRYQARYALGALFLLATASLAMAIPYLLKHAVDAVAAGEPLSVVGGYAVVVTATALVQALARTLSRALIFNVGRDVEYDLRNDLFAHLLRLSPEYYQRQSTGDLMSRLVNDVTAVRMMLGPGILNLINTPLYYAYGLAIMLHLDWRLTLLALAPYPFLLLAVKRLSWRMMEGTLRVQEGLAELSTRVQENVAGSHVVRAHAAEEAEIARFRAANDRFREVSIVLARVRGSLFPLMRLATGAGSLAVLWYGGWAAVSGQLSVGDLVAFLGYLNLLAWPTMAMGWILSVLQRGRAAMQRLEEVLSAEPTVRDAADAEPLGTARGEIEFRNVTFAYPGREREPALREVSLSVAAGSTLGVVGHTGSGKSSLAMLLPRLWDPTAGEILIDGRDARRVPVRELRRLIRVVPQDPFLFSTTVRANIAFAVDQVPDEEIRRVARLVGIDQEVERFPAGYETVVGERGITLSGGQKQRLALARALLAPAPVLVLDDPLSSVDAETEARIVRALESDQRGRTTQIVISHRISAVQNADRIVVLRRGRIAEAGRHEELLRRGGLYAALFRQQRLEEEIAAL